MRRKKGVNQLLAISRFIDEQCFATKQGAVGVAVKFRGVDGSCLTQPALASYSQRLSRAFGVLDDRFRTYLYLIKHGETPMANTENLKDSVARTIKERASAISKRGVYVIELRMVVLLERPREKNPFALSAKKILKQARKHSRDDRDFLLAKVNALLAESQHILGGAICHKDETFTLFRKLVNVDPEQAGLAKLRRDDHVDCFLPEVDPAIHPHGITLGDKKVEVLTIRDVPSFTQPQFFADLVRLPADFILCCEFKPVPMFQAKNIISSAESHFYFAQYLKNPAALVGMLWNKFFGNGDEKQDIVPDKAAQADVDELGNLSVQLRSDQLVSFSTTVLFHGRTREELANVAAEAIRVFGNYEGALYRETYNAFNAYLSILPGTTNRNFRRVWMLRSSVVDMAPLYVAAQGEKTNQFLEREYLVPVETEDKTIHHLNLHYYDVFGVFACGMTGAGKSVLANTIIDHMMKYQPYVCILDIGGSYKQVCHSNGGSYVSLRMDEGEQDWFINPFVLQPTKDNLQFLATFVRLLLTNNGYHVTHQDDRAIYAAVRAIYELEPEMRRLGNLAHSDLGENALPAHLLDVLYNWIGDGQYGSIFDSGKDTIAMADMQVFDLQGLDKYPQIIEPLLFYIFRRFSTIVENPETLTRFKLFWMDEVWRFLANDTCRQQLITAGKTYRKHNGGMGLVTQSSFDLKNVGMLEIIQEVCPTKLLLANPNADFKAYAETFHLNAAEVERFRNLIWKQQFMVKKAEEPAVVLNLYPSKRELLKYGNSPFENKRREEAIKKHGDKWMDVLSGEEVA